MLQIICAIVPPLLVVLLKYWFIDRKAAHHETTWEVRIAFSHHQFPDSGSE